MFFCLHFEEIGCLYAWLLFSFLAAKQCCGFVFVKRKFIAAADTRKQEWNIKCWVWIFVQLLCGSVNCSARSRCRLEVVKTDHDITYPPNTDSPCLLPVTGMALLVLCKQTEMVFSLYTMVFYTQLCFTEFPTLAISFVKQRSKYVTSNAQQWLILLTPPSCCSFPWPAHVWQHTRLFCFLLDSFIMLIARESEWELLMRGIRLRLTIHLHHPILLGAEGQLRQTAS